MTSIKPTNKSKLCLITPINLLNDYGSQSSMHLILAHVAEQSQTYANFHKKSKKLKILDNGAYELNQPYETNRLLDIASDTQPDVIVLPDYPDTNYKITINMANQTIDNVKQHGYKVMFVPQSIRGDLHGWKRSYEWASKNDDIDIIGMSILGMPNAIPDIPTCYARVLLTQHLIDKDLFNFNKYHHYLGLNSGPALEIPPLLKLNVLDSIDTSHPVWHGICGHRYSVNTDSYCAIKKLNYKVDFDCKVNDSQSLQRIQHNIDLTKSLF